MSPPQFCNIADGFLPCILSQNKKVLLYFVSQFIDGNFRKKIQIGSLANSEYPDEMPQNAAFHLVLHFLLRQKQCSRTELQLNLVVLFCDSMIYIYNGPSQVQ